MKTQMAAGAESAQSWRTHCHTHRDRIRSLDELSTSPRRLVLFERDLILQLARVDASTHDRAVALRMLVELRHVTVREVGCFFRVPADVIVLAISLAVAPAVVEHLIATAAAPPPRVRRRRSQAA